MNVAQRWAGFCRESANRALPAGATARARLCVADHLHAAMHGARSETGAALRRYSAIAAHATRAPDAEAAALYMGALSAVHEIDDVHRDTSLHPGSVIVAAALAAALETRVSGRRLLSAVAAGYEIAVRLSVAAGHRHYHYFHATATCGAVGAAAAAAIVLDLDEAAIANAIGIAATMASGLWEGINDEAVAIKHLHPGLAAERGVRAAQLARLGFASAHRAIEGEKGFLAALAQAGPHAPHETPTAQALEEILVDGVRETWKIERNIFKRYPFCLGCFEPLEGMRRILLDATRAREDVAFVVVETSPPVAWMVGQPDPRNPFQAKFSAPYALALQLAGHDPEAVPMPEALLTDAAVRRAIALIRVEANPEFSRRRARVTVQWKDGTIEEADEPFRNLDEREVWARFAAACRGYLGEDGARLESSVASLASMGDVGELEPLVCAATMI